MKSKIILGKQGRRNKGITLIALVITIIILLILAGATLGILTGENGILGKGQKASEETNKQTAMEKINLKITNIQIATYTEKQQMPNLQDLANGLCNDEENEIEYVSTESKPIASQLPFVDTNGYDSIYTKLTEYPYEFEIDSNLRLASIDGVKVAEKDNSSEELLQKMNALETAINAQSEEINKLKTTVTDQANKITALESEKRVKLINNPVNISLQSGWAEGDFANVTLSDSIENYKYLEIQLYTTNTKVMINDTNIIATETIKKYNNSNTLNVANTSMFWIEGDMTRLAAYSWFKNNKTLHIGGLRNNNGASNLIIQNIYGIK